MSLLAWAWAWAWRVARFGGRGFCRRTLSPCAHTHSFHGGELSSAGVCFCWSELLLAWLAYAAAGVAGGASAGGLHWVNPFATGPGL